MDFKQFSELSDDQRAQLVALTKSVRWNALKIASSTLAFFFISVVSISGLSLYYVHSQAFCFIGGGINGYFIFGSMFRSLRQEHDRISQEVKKILA